MSAVKSQVELMNITDLNTLHNLVIKQGQNLQIQFCTNQESLEPIIVKITQLEKSRFRLILIIKNSVEVDLDLFISGNQTETSIFNLVELDDDSTVRLNQKIMTSFDSNFVEHKTKCLLDNSSKASVTHIIQASLKTKNLRLEQKIQTLLLSPKSRIKMQPIMQIRSQDVQCKHGASQGLLDNQALFYLQTRGIDQKISKHVLKQVFKDEILDMIIKNSK